MKKNILALGLAAMMLTLPGCVKDTTNDLTNGTGELVKKTFTVKMELPQNEDGSRLALNEENAFVWEDGDAIQIMGSNGVVYDASADLQGMDGLRLDEGVTFTSDMPADVTPKYAWRNIKHGALGSDNMANFGSTSATGDKPNASSATGRLGTQNNNMLGATSLSALIESMPMVGTFDESGNLFMRNIFAIAELRVRGTGRLWSAHIFSKDMAFRSAYGYVSFTSTEPVWSVYNTVQRNSSGLSPKGMASHSVGGQAVTSDTPLSIFFALPLDAGSGNFNTTHVHAAGSLGIVLRGDVNSGPDFAISKVSTKAHRFTRNMITPISLTFNKPTTGDNATDLSANGDSNCWMVEPKSADAHYKFKAFTNDGASHTGDGYFVFPAWETPNSPVKDVWYESITSTSTDENGESVTVAETPYVHFTVKGGTQNGNTLLAMGKGSHAQHWCQEIWHIWVSDAEDQEYGGMTILDRNVGATYMPKSVADVQAMDGAKAAETCGLYYQWGRQTPFGIPKSLDGTYTTGTEFGWETGKSNSHGNTNIEVFKAMPWSASGFTSYPNTAKTVGAYKDYLTEVMCCTAAENAYQWAINLASPISGNDIAWKYQAKGPQDPCPQGYRVATHDELVKIFRYPNGSSGGHMKYRHWDTVNKQWILAGKYEASELKEGTTDSYAQHEYGGYHQSALTNNNFVWVPYSGVRYGNAAGLTAVSADVGALRWAGYDEDARYTNHSTQDDKGGRTYIWGVPSEANMTAEGRAYLGSPSHSNVRTSYTTNAKMPFAPVMEMRNGGNVYDNNNAIAFNNALPVRCVKLDTADAAL